MRSKNLEKVHVYSVFLPSFSLKYFNTTFLALRRSRLFMEPAEVVER